MSRSDSEEVSSEDSVLSQSSPERTIPWIPLLILHVVVAVAIALAVTFSYQGIFPFDNPLGIYRPIPGDILIDFLWIYAISIVTSVIVYFVVPRLSLVILAGHRILAGGSYRYYIQKIEGRVHRKASLGRSIIPAFAALGISSTLSNIPSIADFIFVTESFDSIAAEFRQPLAISMPLFFILLLLSCIIVIFFAPAWFLEDLRIICERDIEGTPQTADIEGVCNSYLKFLKGLAGISTLLAYLLASVHIVSWFSSLSGSIEIPIVFYILPVVVVLFAPLIAVAPISISMISYELTLRKSEQAMNDRMKQRGLTLIDVKLSEA
ncbi:MAG: hypothetical protein JSW61_06135 [Candidatus Thorarchaeota archaeon]|nr:MAG: hypothetical protein JSW61_06135 [Candidatus Thorarchaeota archaeon]